jgi:hypothetical protein
MGNGTATVHLDSRVKSEPTTCGKNQAGTWKVVLVLQREPRTGPRRAGTGGEWAKERRVYEEKRSVIVCECGVKSEPATCGKNQAGTWKAVVVLQREPHTGP